MRQEDPLKMRTLVLVTAGSSQLDRDELSRLEKEDRHPRATLFPDALNADLLDGRYFERLRRWRRFLYAPFPVWSAQVVEAYFQRRNYDAIISWGEQLTLGFALLLWLTRKHVPHIALSYSISQRRKAKLLKLTQGKIDRLVLWTSSQVDFALNKLGIPQPKVIPVHWGVDQNFYRPLAIGTDMICSAGREMRDYGTLIEALRDSQIRCHIAAYSVPRKHDAWIKAVRNAMPLPPHITIGRMKNVVELRMLYAKSRFVVLPLLQNETDSGTGVIVQAMAMGKAVICSKTRGQRDHVEDGKTGIYVPVGNPSALREAIQYLWDNPELADRMGHEGRKRVEQHHTLDQFVNRIRCVVEEVIGEYRSSRESSLEIREKPAVRV
jgi:glycosyltransferase involved in cell wall biosynthesis